MKITKFGTIYKDETGNIVLSDFELESNTDVDAKLAYIDVIDAIIQEFHIERAEIARGQEQAHETKN